MTDIEIARNTRLEPISKIAKKLNISEEEIEQYGKYKAKISENTIERLKNKKERKINISYSNEPNTTWRGKNYSINSNSRWAK